MADMTRHASMSTLRVPGRNFGKLFNDLEPFSPPLEFIEYIGGSEGLMDEGLVDDQSHMSSTIPAGFTFLGQFIDHDITRDDTDLEAEIDPTTGKVIENIRTPVLELDSVYGEEPKDSPKNDGLYRQDDPDKFNYTGPKGFDPNPGSDQIDDLPRRENGEAIIGDSRNDENVVISQLHLAFLKFHNKVVDFVRANPTVKETNETTFQAAQRLVRWHYQWIVLHEYLPLIAGQAVIDDVLANGRKFYLPSTPESTFMPLEFSVAAFRLGHSQVRNRFYINQDVEKQLFDLTFFGPTPPQFKIDWRYFFNIPPFEAPHYPQYPQYSKKIDAKIAKILLDLPLPIVANQPPTNLAIRNLIRGMNRGLASGQAVANRMGYPPLSNQQLGIMDNRASEAPLWYYILKEAELQTGGETLGQVGGRIVAEVFIGLLQADPKSFLAAQLDWKPILPTLSGQTGTFSMTDLIAFVRDWTSGDFGIVPVYQYHAEAPVWRYFYTTDPDVGLGWIRDGIAFYAFTEDQPIAETDSPLIEIIRYVATSPYRYYYLPATTTPPGSGWIREGTAFRAFSASGANHTRPVYQYSAPNPQRYRYSTVMDAAIGDKTPGGWRNDGEAFWVLNTSPGIQSV